MKKTLAALLLLAVTAAGPAFAGHDHHDQPLGQISLQANALREVDNDTMRATLYAEDEDANATKLADRINRVIAEGVRTAKQESKVKVTTGVYQTYPVYDKTRIVRWRARSEIVLESRDFKVLSDLLGTLQGSLKLGGIGFSVSDEARRAIEDELTKEAIAEFRRRAELIATSFGASGFRIKDAAVNADGGMPPPRPMLMMAMRGKAEADAVAAPAVEAGTSRLSVNVNGNVLLEGLQ